VGRVIRPHGVDGEVRVYVFEPGAPNLARGRSVTVQGVIRKITRMREDRADLLIAFEGITNRDMAMELRGELLELPDRLVKRNDDESYFLHELVGLSVETEDGEVIGKIREILQPGANDVYVVDTASGELLVPVIEDVVRKIDVKNNRVIIVPLSGMLDMSK
jgi:16S rRNA processing protein RimM